MLHRRSVSGQQEARSEVEAEDRRANDGDEREPACGPDAANVLFHVVNERYLHHRPMIFTTNKPLAAWGPVLHDPDLAQAILDRALERGRHLELRGPSYRTRHMKLDLNQDPESSSSTPARISGNRLPECPEPTAGPRPTVAAYPLPPRLPWRHSSLTAQLLLA
jgi:IstB-like ATP binding protein